MSFDESVPFSEYIIYVDESGDHGLSSIDLQYPVFVLTFCLFKISDFTGQILPELKAFKFRHFGHDLEILHEKEIRKREAPYNFLNSPAKSESFHEELSTILKNAPFTIISCIIKKLEYRNTRYKTDNPYDIAAKYGLERVFKCLQEMGQENRKTFVIFESRGKNEDNALLSALHGIQADTELVDMRKAFEFRIAPKSSNLIGLQIADLVARPIGLHVLRPDQPNRAVQIALSKVRRSPSGIMLGWGLKIVPS